MTRQELLDLYFMEARSKLIEIAAFLDRVDRADGEADFRLAAFRAALKELDRGEPARARSRQRWPRPPWAAPRDRRAAGSIPEGGPCDAGEASRRRRSRAKERAFKSAGEARRDQGRSSELCRIGKDFGNRIEVRGVRTKAAPR